MACDSIEILGSCPFCHDIAIKRKLSIDDEYGDYDIEMFDFRWEAQKLHGGKHSFLCPKCGWKHEANVQSRNGLDCDSFIVCRNFAAVIAGKKFNFCAVVLTCERCFYTDYYRPAVRIECGHLRIYPPIDMHCINKAYEMPSVWEERMMKCRNSQ